MFRRYYQTHTETIKELEHKKRIVEMKCEERNLKLEILKLRFSFCFKPQFNKIIVSFSIVAIIAYTVAAILLQKYIQMELSPTLTTAVFSFFGVELINLSRIKINDTRFTKSEPDHISEKTIHNDPDPVG